MYRTLTSERNPTPDVVTVLGPVRPEVRERQLAGVRPRADDRRYLCRTNRVDEHDRAVREYYSSAVGELVHLAGVDDHRITEISGRYIEGSVKPLLGYLSHGERVGDLSPGQVGIGQPDSHLGASYIAGEGAACR